MEIWSKCCNLIVSDNCSSNLDNKFGTNWGFEYYLHGNDTLKLLLSQEFEIVNKF